MKAGYELNESRLKKPVQCMSWSLKVNVDVFRPLRSMTLTSQLSHEIEEHFDDENQYSLIDI